jgi:hypothetical protein
MRKVHPTDMVAHLWAHQTQSEARNAQGNFYFNGDTIWSYGSHFPIARHVGKVVLFTTRTYSSTTAGQCSAVRQAITGVKPIIYCFNPRAESPREHGENLQHMIGIVAGLAAKFETSRTEKASLLKSWINAIADANAYARLFKLKQRVKAVRVTAVMKKAIKISEEKLAQHRASVEKRRTEKYERFKRLNIEAARLRAEAEAQWERDREAVWQAWLRGEGNTNLLKDRGDRPVMLRAIPVVKPHAVSEPAPSIQGYVVETTLGAIVPLEDVHKAYALWSLCYTRKRSWHRNGEQIKVGDFQLDSISETGDVVAGCHRIHADEILRFAKTQDWTVPTTPV